MPSGGMYTSTFSVLGSTLASAPRCTWALNQMLPLGSRISPCAVAALPLGALTLKGLIAPVLASMRPTVMVLLLVTAANQRLPSRSAAASCGSEPPREVVPIDQSLPLTGGMRDGSATSGLSGTSYSL